MYMKRLHLASLIILVIAVTTFIHFNNLIEGFAAAAADMVEGITEV